MLKDIVKFFSSPFCLLLAVVFSTVCLAPISATERDDKQIRVRKNQKHEHSEKKHSLKEKRQPKKNNRFPLEHQLPALPVQDQLKKFIYDLGEKKEQLQKTYMYWTLSGACAGYSLYNNSEDVVYRCLHVALTVAPYITPHLPSGVQPYFQGGIRGTGFSLEGMRALVHTKQWAWEQILGYSSLCFMQALPEGTLGEEMQGGIYFFFKAAGFYRVNFSFPYLPDSLWEQITCHHTSCNAVANDTLSGAVGETPPSARLILSKAKKREMYNELDVAFHDAEPCEPDTYNFLEKNGFLGAYREKINSCNSIVSSWGALKPKHLGTRSFSTAPSSGVFIVNQRQYAVANRTDSPLIFATADIMKCVGLALYTPERCGLAHIDGENIRSLDAYLEGKSTIDDFQRFFLDVAEKTPLNKIRATLISGYAPHINYLKKYMESFGIENIEVIYDSQWAKLGNSYYNNELPKGSIAIDCRSGDLWKIANEPTIRKQMGPPPENDKGHPRPLKRVGR